MTFTKILIVNRGEIACRIIRTARALGYRTVAVHSDADAHAPHVTQADEAIHLAGNSAADTYLAIDKILAAAKQTGADAIHPGYGFLSERAEFAQACADNALVFIGPPPTAITAMGDKAAAKRRMIEAKVPTVPGYLGDEQSEAALTQVERDVESDLWRNARLLETEAQNLNAAKMLLRAASQSYQITFGRYKAGVGSILELISTQVALSNARSQLTQAQLGHAQARLRLEVASGRVVLNK